MHIDYSWERSGPVRSGLFPKKKDRTDLTTLCILNFYKKKK